MKETTKYYVVKEKAVPEVLLKVVEAKRLMETRKAITIQEAVDKVGISRSSFYKYKDDIFQFHDKIAVGDVVEGTVKNVTDFGAFIDLGGADGLLHISEMSWGRIESPKKVFKVGESVKAFIKDINGTKIALSMKFEDANPWKDADVKYADCNHKRHHYPSLDIKERKRTILFFLLTDAMCVLSV